MLLLVIGNGGGGAMGVTFLFIGEGEGGVLGVPLLVIGEGGGGASGKCFVISLLSGVWEELLVVTLWPLVTWRVRGRCGSGICSDINYVPDEGQSNFCHNNVSVY